MKFPGTDVTEEGLEQIRLLKAEKAISSDAERNISSCLITINAGKELLAGILAGNRLDTMIINSLQPEKDYVSGALGNLIGGLSKSTETLDQALIEIKKMAELAKRVVTLIGDAESKQSQIFSIAIKGRKMLKRAKNLEEKEKKQIIIKAWSLGAVITNLSNAKMHVNLAITLINPAVREYQSAKGLFGGVKSDVFMNLAAGYIAQMKKYLEFAKKHLNTAAVICSTDVLLIKRFKEYLSIPENKIKEALQYERIIAKLIKQ